MYLVEGHVEPAPNPAGYAPQGCGGGRIQGFVAGYRFAAKRIGSAVLNATGKVNNAMAVAPNIFLALKKTPGPM